MQYFAIFSFLKHTLQGALLKERKGATQGQEQGRKCFFLQMCRLIVQVWDEVPEQCVWI